MDERQIARSLLINLPEVVMSSWIDPFIMKYSWPFTSLTTEIRGTIWNDLFFGLPLIDFAQLKWDACSFSLNEFRLHRYSAAGIKKIIDYIYLENDLENQEPFKNSNDRYFYHHNFIIEHNRLCVPVVLGKTDDGFIVFDGSHRLAALIQEYNIKIPIDAWVTTNCIVV